MAPRTPCPADRRGTCRTSCRVLIALATPLALMYTACSDGSSADEQSTSSASSPVSASPSTGAPATTSTSTSSTSSTVVATTTTVDVVAVTKQAVMQAAIASREAYLYAIYNLDAPDAQARLEATSADGSESLAQAAANVALLRQRGWRSRPNPSIPSTLTVEGDVALYGSPSANQAQLVACIVNAGVVYEPPAAEGLPETVVNDNVVSRRTRITLVLEDGLWKVSSGDSLGEWNGTPTCGES
jgi:hypothetical protein